jgi:protein-glutamine gamma-glutamyltransferase
MPTDSTFRASTYLTFALACVCIWYAEWETLPEIGLVAGGAIVALVVLFRLETRVELLSIPAASRLGVILGLLSILWGTGRLLWERQNNKLQNVTWVLMGVMMFGVVLISLMPAKLARREKHAGDYWFLHGIALVIVIVAGAIAEDTICFMLIILYAGTAVWSLSLFHLRQASGSILSAPGERSSPAMGSVIATSVRQLGIRQAIGIVAFTSLLAVPLYLITPRSTATKLTFDQSRIEIGFNADQMTDLNQTGDLKSNDAAAFEVEAEVDGHPVSNLAPNQRWRGQFSVITIREYGDRTSVICFFLERPQISRVTGPGRLPILGKGKSNSLFPCHPSNRATFWQIPSCGEKAKTYRSHF